MQVKYLIPLSLLILFISLSSYSQKITPRISYSDYIDKYKDISVRKMHEFKIPASITLAQGLLESGSGNSDLAVNANNHFGIKCHKEWTGMTYIMDDDEKNECFRKYESPEESFNDHSLFLTSRPRYSGLFSLEMHDYKGWAHGLKAAGYATNPRYAELLIKIIEEHQLFLFDKESSKEKLLADIQKNIPNVNELQKESETLRSFNFKYVEVAEGNRMIYVNNGVRLTYARAGDKAQTIAHDLGIHTFQILAYNELGRDEIIKPGAIVYVEPKKKKATQEYHIVSENETMRDIAQLYAIKLKVLYKKNKLQMGHDPAPGTKLQLKKNKS